MSTKAEIRQQIKPAKQNLTQEEITQKSSSILEHLKEQLVLYAYKSVHIYEALDMLKEPLTEPIIHYLEESHPTISIYMPIVNQAHKSQLVTSQNVINFNKQIFPDKRTMLLDDNIDLFILPLVAFDLSGNRLGHGGGFYDKLLYHYPKAKKIGLAFDLQKVGSIPTEGHDVKLDAVITETQIYRCRIT